MRAVYNTPHEAFPLLCSWLAVESLRSSYTVKTKAYSYALYVYMSAQPLPIGASGMGIDVTKITLLSWKPLFWAGKIWFLRFDLTLLNINMSKNPLPHDFSCQKVCIINDYLYFCSVSSSRASLQCLNRLGFFVYKLWQREFLEKLTRLHENL